MSKSKPKTTTPPKKIHAPSKTVPPKPTTTTTATATAAAAAVTAVTDAAKEYPEFMKHRPTFLKLQAKILDKYGRSKRYCKRVPLTEFAVRGINEHTKCSLCADGILGDCKAAYLITSFYDDSVKPLWIHDSCFVCAATKTQQGGITETCREAVSYKVATDPSKNYCYIDIHNRAVCINHICRENIDFPSFDPETQGEKAVEFMNKVGFVILNTDITPEKADFYKNWEQNVVGLLCGMAAGDVEDCMDKDGWNCVHHYPGIDRSEMGIIGDSQIIEGESDEANAFRMKTFRAEPLVQAREVWQMRTDVLPAARPFFDGQHENIFTAIPPLLLAAKNSVAEHNGAPRCFVSEKRTTNVATAEKAGRKNAIKSINGIVVFSDATEGQIRVMACPSTWKTRPPGATNDVTHNFTEVWNGCVPRAPDMGIFPKTFPLAALMVSVKLTKGQVIVWDSFRPFSVHASKTSNLFGSFVGWNTLAPKLATLKARALGVMQGGIKKKDLMQTGYKHPKLLKNAFTDDAPRDFADTITPLTRENIGCFASVIFGSRKINPKYWPKEYRNDNNVPEDDMAEELVGSDNEDQYEDLKSSPQKDQKMSDEDPPVAVVKPAPKKKVAPPPPPVVEEQEQEEDDLDLEPMDEEEEPVVVAVTKKPAAPVKKAPAPKKPVKKVAPVVVEEEEEVVVEKPKKTTTSTKKRAPVVEEEEEEEEEEEVVVEAPKKKKPAPKPSVVVEEDVAVVEKPKKTTSTKKRVPVVEEEEEEVVVEAPKKKKPAPKPPVVIEEEVAVVEKPKKKPAAPKVVPPKKKVPPKEVEADEEEEEVIQEEEEEKPKATKAKKRPAPKESEFPSPFPDGVAELEPGVVPEQLHMERDFATHEDVVGAYASLFSLPPNISQSDNDEGSVVVNIEGTTTSLELMDAFDRLGLDEGAEEKLRNYIDTFANGERGELTEKRIKRRTVAVYGCTARVGSGNQKPEPTPGCLQLLLDHINTKILSESTGNDGEVEEEGGTPKFDQIVAYGLNRQGECINPLRRGENVAPGSHVYFLFLGASNRRLRIKKLAQNDGDDDNDGDDEKKKAKKPFDLNICTGLGIYSDNNFFSKRGGVVINIPLLKSIKVSDGAPVDTTPFVMLMFTTGRKPDPTKKKRNTRKKKEDGAAAKKKKKTIAPFNSSGYYGKTLKAVGDEATAFKEAHKTVILTNKQFTELYKNMRSAMIEATSKKGDIRVKFADFRQAFAKLYKAVSGEKWDDGNETAKAEALEAYNAAIEDEDEDEEEDNAKAIKPAKPVKKPHIDEDEMECADDPNAIPEKTRKGVFVGGKLALRGTRERKQAESKVDIADAEAREIDTRNWKTSEARRRRQLGAAFREMPFNAWQRAEGKKKGVSRLEGTVDFPDELGLVDDDDGGEFNSDDDDEDEDDVVDVSDSSNQEQQEDGIEDGEEVDELVDLAEKLEQYGVIIDTIYDTYKETIEDKSTAESKMVGKTYRVASKAFEECNNEALDENLSEAIINDLLLKVTKFQSALDAFLEVNPDKRIVKRSKAKRAKVDPEPILHLEGLEVEGWNVKFDPQVSDAFVRSLTEAGNLLWDAIDTNNINKVLPELKEQYAQFKTLVPEYDEEVMQGFIDTTKQAMQHFYFDEDGDVVMEEEEEEEAEVPDVVHDEKEPMDEGNDGEEEDEDDFVVGEDVIAGPSSPPANSEDDTGGSGVEEEPKPMEQEESLVSAPQPELEDEPEPVTPKKVPTPTVVLSPAKQSEPVADEDENLEGSAQEAANDKGKVVAPDAQKEVAPVEVEDAKLDVVVTKSPAKKLERFSGDKFVAVLTNGSLFATGDTVFAVRDYAISQISSKTNGTNTNYDSYFRVLPLPSNWKQSMATALKLASPEAANIQKIRQLKADNLWPNGGWKKQ